MLVGNLNLCNLTTTPNAKFHQDAVTEFNIQHHMFIQCTWSTILLSKDKMEDTGRFAKMVINDHYPVSIPFEEREYFGFPESIDKEMYREFNCHYSKPYDNT